ncbi:hypothetical protein PRNP1_008427 [Phytophthora ramorum]
MASPVRSRRTSVDEDNSSAEEETLSRRASVASMRQALEEDEERQRQDAAVAALAQQSAAVQQLTFEQLKKFHDQQEEMVQRFSGYLQEQFENQLQLKGEYDALRAQMEQQKQQMAAHTSILREASEKPPHDEADDVKMEDTTEDGHSALPDQAVSSRTGTSGNPASTPGKSGSQRDGTSKKQRSGHGQKNGPMPPRPAPQVPPVKLGSDTKHASPQQEKKCYKCGDKNHLVFQCPQVTREEALELVRERRKEGVGAVTSLPTARPVGSQLDQDKPTIACEINGTVAGHITQDTGTEYSIVAESLVNRLKMAKQWLPIRNLDARVKAEGFGGAVVIITQEVKLNLAVNTPAGKLLLTNVVCWISPEELPAGKGDVLLSRPLMRKLGYDPVEILAKARALNSPVRTA